MFFKGIILLLTMFFLFYPKEIQTVKIQKACIVASWKENVLKRPQFAQLKKIFTKYGVDLQMNSVYKPEESDFCIYLSVTDIDPKQKNKSFLFWLESPIWYDNPDAWFKNFNKSWTWDRKFVDNKNVFHMPIIYSADCKKNFTPVQKEILVTQVASMGLQGQPAFDYKERINIFEWFLENHPDDFINYGHYWTDKEFSPAAKKQFHKRNKGYVQDKLSTIAKSKFVVAFENFFKDDYITEKIFDPMCAGSVPIYYGASNISQSIPKNTYIDMRDFKNYEELYNYISTMSPQTYQTYLNNISNFLNSPHMIYWNGTHLMPIIADKIMKSLKTETLP